MSLKEVTMYTVKCDGCGSEAFEGQEITAWNDKGTAVEFAEANERFIQHEGKDYCPNCTKWNEDETELIPKPEVS